MRKPDNAQDDGSKSRIEFSVKITNPDGTVVEKTVTSYKEIPGVGNFDLSTREGLLADFDSLENAIVEARNSAGAAITGAYLDEAAKKKRNRMPNDGDRQ